MAGTAEKYPSAAPCSSQNLPRGSRRRHTAAGLASPDPIPLDKSRRVSRPTDLYRSLLLVDLAPRVHLRRRHAKLLNDRPFA